MLAAGVGISLCLDLSVGLSRGAFQVYVNRLLVPELAPGDIIVMDNLGSYNGPAVQAANSAEHAANSVDLPADSADRSAGLIADIVANLTAGCHDHATDQPGVLRTCCHGTGWHSRVSLRPPEPEGRSPALTQGRFASGFARVAVVPLTQASTTVYSAQAQVAFHSL